VETKLLNHQKNATVLCAAPKDAPSFKPERAVDKEFLEPQKPVSPRLVVIPKETANLQPSKETPKRSAKLPLDKRELATLSLVSVWLNTNIAHIQI